jgi:SAM-dependent methyltransferase
VVTGGVDAARSRVHTLHAGSAHVTSTSNFSGSIPRSYDERLGPLLFEPYAAEVARRVPASALRVLEVACGTGIVTRHLHAVLPAAATLVATDLNQAMVDYARAALPAERIAWQVADAQDLPFGDESFDAVVFQFGLMFLPDRPRGFREARRVLVPGGVLLATVWLPTHEHPAVAAMETVLRELFPEDPPRFLDTPYGYNDAARIRADAAAGGFGEIELETVRFQTTAPSALEFAKGFVYGTPLTHNLKQRGADLDAVAGAIARSAAGVGGSDPFTLDVAAIVITATRP